MSLKLTLPCGFMHDGVHVKEIELDEMSGHEEDLLTGGEQPGKSLSQEILSCCIQSLAGKTVVATKKVERIARGKAFLPLVEKMLLQDIPFLIVSLRQASLGDKFEFESTCPSCKHTEKRTVVDLKDFLEHGRKDMETEAGTPRAPELENSLTLPSGKELVWRHLLGSDSAFVSKAQRERRKDILSMLLFRRTVTINGEPVTSVEDMKNLSTRDRDAFRKEIANTEGGMESEIEVTCPACGNAWSEDLPVTHKSFFFPSGVR